MSSLGGMVGYSTHLPAIAVHTLTQCLKRRVIRSGTVAEDQRVAKPVDVEIHHRAHRPIPVGLHELGRAEQPQFFHVEKHDPHLRPRPRL